MIFFHYFLFVYFLLSVCLVICTVCPVLDIQDIYTIYNIYDSVYFNTLEVTSTMCFMLLDGKRSSGRRLNISVI